MWNTVLWFFLRISNLVLAQLLADRSVHKAVCTDPPEVSSTQVFFFGKYFAQCVCCKELENLFCCLIKVNVMINQYGVCHHLFSLSNASYIYINFHYIIGWHWPYIPNFHATIKILLFARCVERKSSPKCLFSYNDNISWFISSKHLFRLPARLRLLRWPFSG